MESLHLFTHEFFPTPGGAGAVVEQLARAAKRNCPERPVTVWAPVHPDLPRQRDGYEIIPLPVRGKQGWPDRLRHTAAVRPWLGELGSAFVHLAEPGALRSWMDLAKHFPPRIPRFGITLHGSEILKLSATASRRRKFVALCARAEWIHVLSNYCTRLFNDRFPGFEERIRVTGGACTVRDPGDAASEGNRDHEDPALAPLARHLRCLTVGRLHPRKGQLALVEAVATLDREVRDRIELRIVGPRVRGNYARAVQSAITRHRIPATLTGPLDPDALATEYTRADCFVFPSQPTPKSIEGLGLACLDASLHALPVIASNIGGVGEAVLHGQTGLLVDPTDPADLGNALRQLLENTRQREQLGQAGRRFAASLSWDRIAATLYRPLQGCD